MRWQKIARLVIASFVIVFAGIVVHSLRQSARLAPKAESPTKASDSKSISETGEGTLDWSKVDRAITRIKFKKQLTYEGGKSKFVGVELELKDRDGRPIIVTADEADVTTPPDKPSEKSVGHLRGNVMLKTETGLMVCSAEATYDGGEGMLRIPGAVEWTKGRMKGSGVGATYDRNRDVLWILDQARVTSAPDASGGGALEATAGTAGLARADNFLKLVKDAHIVSDGRTADAVEITILLDEKGEKARQLQLREQSKITGSGAGAQLMLARNIDMTYAEDGRTLQSSKLMENAVVELPGSAAGSAGSRIGASTIDIGMSPDGKTVTSLVAIEKVQVDLPAEGESPAKQIRSSSLRATGAPGQGLQNAVFEGGADYLETRPAQAKAPAVERKARAQRLIVDTKPGLGPIEKADFRGKAWFNDGQATAEAPRALYSIDRDQLDLSIAEGESGGTPIVTNPQLTVQALNIHLSPSSQKLTADTEVRSTIKPQKKSTDGKQTQTRVPGMLQQDKPVTVTSNRLSYDGVSEASYSGNALLWQDKSRINADTIVLNDRTGNLTARVGVQTTMMLMDQDPKSKTRKPTETKASADLLVYDDAKRQATYTMSSGSTARLTSVQGDMNGKRIDLFFRESGNELDRAEADDTVSVKLDLLYATGMHLVYTASTDTYVLTGQPAVAIQKDDQGACKQTDGTTMTYLRSTGSLRAEAIAGRVPVVSKPLDACPAELRN
ncbi:MAG TPA: LptA/OstA family protein [Vicinamibacterales bacterium]